MEGVRHIFCDNCEHFRPSTELFQCVRGIVMCEGCSYLPNCTSCWRHLPKGMLTRSNVCFHCKSEYNFEEASTMEGVYAVYCTHYRKVILARGYDYFSTEFTCAECEVLPACYGCDMRYPSGMLAHDEECDEDSGKCGWLMDYCYKCLARENDQILKDGD